MNRFLPLISLLLLIINANGQTFTDIQASISGVEEGSVKWGDYDGDGDLDCFIVGTDLNTLEYTSGLYQNNSGTFTLLDNELKNIATNNTVASWGDFDNDNNIDLVVNSTIYRNQNGAFTDINANLTSLRQGSVSWGDYDGDDDLDLLMTGIDGSSFLSIIYRNDNGTFVDIGAGLSGIWAGTGEWGDFDNDGDLDVLLVGQTGNSGEPNIGKVYENTSNTFSELISFEGIGSGSASWGDYDNDGDLDVLVSGNVNTSGPVAPLTRLYRNDDGNLVDSGISLTNLVESYVGWVDFDADGNLDLMITGQNEDGDSETQLYRNENDSIFLPFLTDFVKVFNGSFDWGDYDGDGLLDVIIIGADNTTGFSFNVKIYNQNLVTPPLFSLDKSSIEVNEDFVDHQQIVVSTDNNIDATYSIAPESVDFCSISFNVETGLVTIVSLQDLSGEQMFTITATDNLMPTNTSSQIFSLKVNAVNDAPQITGLTDDISIPENSSVEISLDNLVVSDVDNTFPDDFTLSSLPGSHYSLSQNLVIPNPNYVGELHVPVRVNDGTLDSEVFNVSIAITEVLGIDNQFIDGHFFAYPNPISDYLSLEFDNSIDSYQAKVFALDGKLVYSYGGLVESQIELIDLSTLQEGTYILQIVSENGVELKKLIKN